MKLMQATLAAVLVTGLAAPAFAQNAPGGTTPPAPPAPSTTTTKPAPAPSTTGTDAAKTTDKDKEAKPAGQ